VGKKEEEKDGPRYFATIDVKDVSTFAPPPRRVGDIPGARPEDRDKGLQSPISPTQTGNGVDRSNSTSSRPPPPLPSRGRTSLSNSSTSPLPAERPPPTKPPVGAKPTGTAAIKPPSTMPALPPRRESTGPSQEPVAPKLPARESSYGQLRKTFGTAVDSETVNDLRNSLRKSSSSTSKEPAPPARLNMQDARAASGIIQKYKSDPSSLSLRDAKAGLIVANKVLPPTTDNTPPNRHDAETAASIAQKWNKDPKSLGVSDLKAGYAVANKFRPIPARTTSDEPPKAETEPSHERTGVKDLRSRFANVTLGSLGPPPTKTQPIQNEPQLETAKVAPQQKKRPPPPPPPKPKIPSPTSASPPPSLNLSTKPNPPSSSTVTHWAPKDIPLNFETRWYSAEPMQQIPYLAQNPSKFISASTISASGSGFAGNMIWRYTAVFGVRWTSDLSRTFIRVTWSSDKPVSSVRGEQKHFQPPPPLGLSELERAAKIYGGGVVQFARTNMGRQVGNGECWTLAHDALEFMQGTTSPKVMVSNGTIHGQCIYSRDATRTLSGSLDMVREGDIVQYLECKFERRVNGRVVYSSTAGVPDHTSYTLSLWNEANIELSWG